MRLIDADGFKEYITVSEDVLSLFKTEEYKRLTVSTMEAILKDIDEQPTIDAVKVVRCKDCVENDAKYGNEENWCLKFGYTMHDDDFCSYGESENDE